ncbi:MAG: F0F1 ATP synthase subunit A [Oscillospiraceae bacterium]|jgi:F-type H+-transporting ATPase subunit a|nr:F0F1 ATP synthase subunit A [Oscillospiraceae bacterium]
MHESSALFSIGPLEVTRPVVTMWVIIAVLALVSWLATRKLKEEPGPLQSAAELAVTKLRDLYAGSVNREALDKYLPVLGTFFIFIITCNYSGLLPGAGKAFAVPTASLSVTGGLAVSSLLFTLYAGFRKRGLWGYAKTFLSPLPLFFLMLPLNLIEQAVRPVSLAMRLYGNIFGEETAVEQMGVVLPVVLPVIMQVLSLLFGAIQAIVFTKLVAAYLEEATELEEE